MSVSCMVWLIFAYICCQNVASVEQGLTTGIEVDGGRRIYIIHPIENIYII
jgi:hypothetical protein